MAFTVPGEIILRDSATDVLADVGRGLGRLQAEIEDINNASRAQGGFLGGFAQAGGVVSGLRNVAGALRGNVLLAGAMEAVQLGNELASIATESTNLSRSLTQLAGSAEEATDRIRAIEQASGFTVTQMDAMRIANLGASLGFAQTSEDLARLVRLAGQVNAVMGTDLRSSIDEIAASVANLTTQRLDQLGIDAQKVDARFKELNKTLPETRALFLAILGAGEEGFAGVDPIVDSTSELQKAFADLREEAALLFGFGFAPISSALAAGLRFFERGLERNRTGQAALNAELRTAQALLNQLTRGQRTLGQAVAAGLADPAELERLNGLWFQQAEEVARLERALEALDSGPVRELADEVEQLAFNLEDGVNAMEALSILSGRVQVDVADLPPELRQRLGTPDPMFADPGTGPTIGDINAARREEDRRAAEAAAREWQRAAEAAEREWIRAAQAAEREFESIITSLPGVPGGPRSPVTQKDLDFAAAGGLVRFTDDFLRLLEDQLINGVERGIDITEVSERFGVSAALPARQFVDAVVEEWTSGRAFVGGRNFDLANVDALREQYEGILLGRQGQKDFIAKVRESLGPEIADLIAAEQDSPLAQALTGGQTPTAIVSGLQQSISGAMESADFASPVIFGIETQMTAETVLQRLANVGTALAQNIFTGFGDAVVDQPWAQAIIGAIMDNLSEQLEGSLP